MKGSEVTPSNVISLRRKPILVRDRPVYDLHATRRKMQPVSRAEYQGRCPKGVCILDWKPNKPAA